MNQFKLPDLGEGLPDAEIHEWFVRVGDTVAADQPLVSMETAKAVVDVPSPQAGTIAKLFGNPGDVIKTGDPLVSFECSAEKVSEARDDKGTVVGNLEEDADLEEDNFTVGAITSHRTRIKTSPSVKMFAKRLGVDIYKVVGTGEGGFITKADVDAFSKQSHALPEGFEPLKGVRRAMLSSMVKSHEEVVPVSIFDEANLSNWGEKEDITVRIIRAVLRACKEEPALNAWFNNEHSARRCFDEVHLGVAMDSPEGLFVPVIHNAQSLDDAELRSRINQYKNEVSERSVPSENLKGATITLSNFGKFAGKFASPIIVPPTVAIIAVGRLYRGAAVMGESLTAAPLLPLSLSFDHRAITGGEATRFLGTMIQALES